jgi:succinoglycan biosynthesis transport protein ExoP
MLAVGSIPGTNLVELSAEGGQPLLLSDLVNAWLEAYEGQRQAEIEARVGTQLSQLGDETDALAGKIATNARRWSSFANARHRHPGARQQSRTEATEYAAGRPSRPPKTSRSRPRRRLAAVQASLARGEPVISREACRGTGAAGKQRESELEVRVKQLRKRYTEMFIQNDPDKRALPDELARVRARIETVRRTGRSGDAHRGRAAGTGDGHRQAVSAPARVRRAKAHRIALHPELLRVSRRCRRSLDALEAMQRETRDERVSLETSAIEDYPQIEVIDTRLAAAGPGTPALPARPRPIRRRRRRRRHC